MTITETSNIEARIADATSVDPMVAAQAAAADFVKIREMEAQLETLKTARRDRVLATFEAAGVTRLAGVLVTPTETRQFSVDAVLRIKDPAIRDALIVPTVPASNVDAAVKTGALDKRRYGQILAGVTKGKRVELCANDATMLAS